MTLAAGCTVGSADPETPRDAPPITAGAPTPATEAPELSMDRMMGHLKALDGIARSNANTRDAYEPGYQASVDYMRDQLRGLNAQRQDFSTKDGRSANLIADLPGREADGVIVFGAHLDSVQEGPGINDNASGSAAVVEMARQMAQRAEADGPQLNTVRFALWGAEEWGMVGSGKYLESLPDAEREKIKAYINLDMIATPKGSYIVDDGDGSDREAPGAPDGSGELEALLRSPLEKADLRVREFPGSMTFSDGKSFAAEDIPTGGLSAGEAPDDPCYHKACDNIDYIDPEIFGNLADAAAYAVWTLAGKEY